MGNTSSTVPSNTPSPVTTNNTIPSSSSSLPIPSVVQQQPPNINSITDSSTSSPSSTFVFPEPVTGNKDDARLQRLKRPNSIKEVRMNYVRIAGGDGKIAKLPVVEGCT